MADEADPKTVGRECTRLLVPAPIEVDWREFGNALEHQLVFAVAEVFACEGLGFELGAETAIEVKPTGPGAPQSWLRVVKRNDGLIEALLVGTSEPSEEERSAWQEVLRITVDWIRGTTGVERWSAAIGAPLEQTRRLTIGKVTVVGPLSLRQGAFENPGRGRKEALIMVEGETRNTTWLNGRTEAAREIRRLCAILSLFWRTPVVELREPEPSGQEPIPLLRVRRPAKGPTTEVASVPEIVGLYWDQLGDAPWLEGVLLAHHEGVLLMKRHPSFAFLAFVASLEAIGARYVPLTERCVECGQQMGAIKRFRYALGIADLDPDIERRHMEEYHEFRSPTAHVGQLHGYEASFGSVNDNDAFQSSPANSFVLTRLSELRELSASLIERGLRGELPPL